MFYYSQVMINRFKDAEVATDQPLVFNNDQVEFVMLNYSTNNWEVKVMNSSVVSYCYNNYYYTTSRGLTLLTPCCTQFDYLPSIAHTHIHGMCCKQDCEWAHLSYFNWSPRLSVAEHVVPLDILWQPPLLLIVPPCCTTDCVIVNSTLVPILLCEQSLLPASVWQCLHA